MTTREERKQKYLEEAPHFKEVRAATLKALSGGKLESMMPGMELEARVRKELGRPAWWTSEHTEIVRKTMKASETEARPMPRGRPLKYDLQLVEDAEGELVEKCAMYRRRSIFLLSDKHAVVLDTQGDAHTFSSLLEATREIDRNPEDYPE